MKKAFNIAKKVLVWAVVITAVLMMVFTIVSVNTFNRNDRALFGHRVYIVLSDSMSATDFSAGDLVLVKKVDPNTLKEGDIISYQSENKENYGATVTHKIRSITKDANGNFVSCITYGTTTGVDDETPVTSPFILGRYRFSVPKMGTFFNFLKTTQGYIICILIPFLLLILHQGINCVKIFRRYKAEQLEELQAEKDALAAQKKESEDMMAKLLALQAQLEQQQGTTEQPAEAPAEEQPAEQDTTETAESTETIEE